MDNGSKIHRTIYSEVFGYIPTRPRKRVISNYFDRKRGIKPTMSTKPLIQGCRSTSDADYLRGITHGLEVAWLRSQQQSKQDPETLI
jgi:hypothetical protein